jgi:vancomycin resistance protein YoaR
MYKTISGGDRAMKKMFIYIIISVYAVCCCALNGAAEKRNVYSDTPLNESSAAKINNIQLAVNLMDGITLEYGDTFSFNETVGPREAAFGFRVAPNGRGAQVVGGGVAQAATTLYLALLQLDDIEYNRLRTYDSRFTDDYVDSGYYAVMVDYNENFDFAFTSYYPGSLTINIWLNDDCVCCLLNLKSNASDALMGRSATPLYGMDAKVSNISLAADAVDETRLNYSDVFSFNDVVGPRTSARGYQNAANGRGVNVIGGGVAQVASTVYLAIKDNSDVQIIQKKTYGENFIDAYVDDPIDAAILTDYNADIDFSFKYLGYGELVIYTYIVESELICEVYVQ